MTQAAAHARTILTVMPDYGSGPFLWINRTGDDTNGIGPNCCSHGFACSSHPMSQALLRDFSEWVVEFEGASDVDDDSLERLDLDWAGFHARGLVLAQRLKLEVGPAFRVIYSKPIEDGTWRRDQRREILDDGTVLALPSTAVSDRMPFHHIVRAIVSGGQAGADRAALDWAREHRYRIGGWCPKGRRAEDGVIDAAYPLKETESRGYIQRTRLNVTHSDGTLIVNIGELTGGSLVTRQCAERCGCPVLVAQTDAGITADLVSQVIEWVRAHPITTLNVAGPRESKRPGIYRLTWELLDAVENASQEEWRLQPRD